MSRDGPSTGALPLHGRSRPLCQPPSLLAGQGFEGHQETAASTAATHVALTAAKVRQQRRLDFGVVGLLAGASAYAAITVGPADGQRTA